MSAIDVTRDRLGKIGGSDLAAILGYDTYRSPYQAWLDITGRRVRDDTEHMARGRFLEPGISDLVVWRRSRNLAQGQTLLAFPCARLTHPEHEFLIGHPDRLIYDGASFMVLEIKCPERIEWEEPPLTYQIQANHYVGLAKLAKMRAVKKVVPVSDDMVLAVMSGGLREFDFRYDPECFDANVHYAAEWHKKHVVADVAPDLLSDEDVALAHPKSTAGKRVQLTRDDLRWLSILADVDAQLKEAEARKATLSSKLRVLMADAEEAYVEGQLVATNRTSFRNGIDLGGLRLTYPQICAQFDTEKPVRTLLLKREAIRRVTGAPVL